MIGRRRVLEYGLRACGLLLPRWARPQENPWARVLAEYETVRPASYASPLPIPRVLAPVGRDSDADVYDLVAGRGVAQPLPGAPTEVLGFSRTWPGPTLQVTRGRAVRVRLRNDLDENISIHNHGIKTGPGSDGHPVDYVRPGGTKEYAYPNDQSGGTYWYHDHAMGLTGLHVYRGLAGFYLIRDPAEDALGLPSGAFDVPIVLQDRTFDAQNALCYSVGPGTATRGFIGNTLCANGVHTPHFEVSARRYRLRFLNGCNSRNLKLALSSGEPLLQVAADGSLLPAPIARASIDIAPAERCDCVVDFSRCAPGSTVLLRNVDATWPELPDVLRFDVKSGDPDESRVPARLASVERLDEKRAHVRRVLRFQIEDGKWTINGQRFDPARIDFQPRLGTTEIWTLKNAEPTQMHPFHQHLVQFQVLDVDGAPPPAWLAGWKDTVPVGPGSAVRIIMRFTGFTGVYVAHCHKLEHEDQAMMLQQQVIA